MALTGRCQGLRRMFSTTDEGLLHIAGRRVCSRPSGGPTLPGRLTVTPVRSGDDAIGVVGGALSWAFQQC